MRVKLSLGVASLGALALVLAGCSGGSGGGGLTYEDSPLSEYFTSAWGGDLSREEQEVRWAQQQREEQDFVAKCMADEGFEYTPNVQSGNFGVGSDVEYEPDTRDWVERYGYGAVNSPWRELQDEQPPQEYFDPNQEYVDSLTESERDAYYEALYGPSTFVEGDDEYYEYDPLNAGCQGLANNEVYGSNPWQDEQFAGLVERMDALWTELESAPELVSLQAEWASCMADAGEPGFDKPGDAAQSIYEAQDKIYNDFYGDGSEFFDYEAAGDPYDSPEMQELGEREVALALKDLECREKTSFTQESLRIQFEREERFIAENKAELEAFKAAAEQSS